jgi:hypothetical protein
LEKLKIRFPATHTWLTDLKAKLKIRLSSTSVDYVGPDNVPHPFAKITSDGDFVAANSIADPSDIHSISADGNVLLPTSGGGTQPTKGFAVTEGKDANGKQIWGCSGGFCFVATTPVWVNESGIIAPISTLDPGQYVASASLEPGE